MNKSVLTNLIALSLIGLGYSTSSTLLRSAGYFAFSGAITNWLAIHMLFEKVPFLYGSGIIPLHFEDFKRGIKNLMMAEFFNPENLRKFMNSDDGFGAEIDAQPLIQSIDFDSLYNGLTESILSSPFAPMLEMMGGAKALEPMKEPILAKMREKLVEVAESPSTQEALKRAISSSLDHDSMVAKIDHIVQSRLDELSPHSVKVIMQTMIREHLGWLVVWGGVFGGMIGFFMALL